MLEADLVLQAATIPSKIEGLADEEYTQLKQGLKGIQEVERTGLCALRSLTRKAYTKADHAIKDQ